MREKYVKGYFVLSRLLLSDFLLFNLLFWSSIKQFKVLGYQILKFLVLRLESWVPGPGTWVLGPGSGSLFETMPFNCTEIIFLSKNVISLYIYFKFFFYYVTLENIFRILNNSVYFQNIVVCKLFTCFCTSFDWQE